MDDYLSKTNFVGGNKNQNRGIHFDGEITEMSKAENATVTLELVVSSLAQTDALAKLLIERGIIMKQEFLAKISEERATYQAMFKPTPH